MIGVPPICQSPDGNGGESNGAAGMRRFEGEALLVSLSKSSCAFMGATAKNRENTDPMKVAARRWRGRMPGKFVAIIQLQRGRAQRGASGSAPLESGGAAARVLDKPSPKRRSRLSGAGHLARTGVPIALVDSILPDF